VHADHWWEGAFRERVFSLIKFGRVEAGKDLEEQGRESDWDWVSFGMSFTFIASSNRGEDHVFIFTFEKQRD
jgi:hypothetical protein